MLVDDQVVVLYALNPAPLGSGIALRYIDETTNMVTILRHYGVMLVGDQYYHPKQVESEFPRGGRGLCYNNTNLMTTTGDTNLIMATGFTSGFTSSLPVRVVLLAYRELSRHFDRRTVLWRTYIRISSIVFKT